MDRLMSVVFTTVCLSVTAVWTALLAWGAALLISG